MGQLRADGGRSPSLLLLVGQTYQRSAPLITHYKMLRVTNSKLPLPGKVDRRRGSAWRWVGEGVVTTETEEAEEEPSLWQQLLGVGLELCR